jgi:hypothetical protein
MKYQWKVILWLLPLLGCVLGYVYAYVFFHGLLEIWHPAGKPEEDVTQILGVRDARDVLVATETGKIYSFAFAGADEGTLWLPPVWKREDRDSSQPVAQIRYYGADFFTWPPLFPVVQLYEMEYIYKVEGKGEVKFALAADGQVWVWKHRIAGLTGLVFYYYPAAGLLAGLFAALGIKGRKQPGVIISPG